MTKEVTFKLKPGTAPLSGAPCIFADRGWDDKSCFSRTSVPSVALLEFCVHSILEPLGGDLGDLLGDVMVALGVNCNSSDSFTFILRFRFGNVELSSKSGTRIGCVGSVGFMLFSFLSDILSPLYFPQGCYSYFNTEFSIILSSTLL